MLPCESELEVKIIKKVSFPCPFFQTRNAALDFYPLMRLLVLLHSMLGRIFHYGSIGLIEEPCRSIHLFALDIAKKIWYHPPTFYQNLRMAL
ncbi:unnamed protein product [Ilex paraguariensis]